MINDTFNEKVLGKSDYWIGIVEKQSIELERLNTSTENEFLSIGAHLQDLYLKSEKMSAMASSAGQIISSDEIINAIQELENMLYKIDEYLAFSDNHLDGNTRNLTDIGNNLNVLKRHLEGFKKVVKILKMMAISTRIESARLSNSDASFNTIADDIKELSSRIAVKSGHIMEESYGLGDRMEAILHRVADLLEKHRTEKKDTIEKTSLSLTSLKELTHKSSSSVEHIKEISEEIHSHVGETVTSIQFHDITRQQLEHVRDAFLDICRWIKQLDGKSDDITSLLCKSGEVGILQKDQLYHSKEEFVSAVETIIHSLQSISQHISFIITETHKIVSDSKGASHLSEIESGISSVMASLEKNVEAYGDLSSSMSLTGENVRKMASFVKDIKQTGNEIELIAINARIKSTHTGSAGVTMGAIAEAIQQLSVDARKETGFVMENLEAIVLKAEEITSQTSVDDKTSEIKSMLDNIKNILNNIKHLDDNLTNLIVKLNQDGKELVAHIDRMSKSLTVHRRFENTVNNVIKNLDMFINDYENIISISDVDRKHFLKDLEKRYTMESERKVHQAKISSTGKKDRSVKNISSTGKKDRSVKNISKDVKKTSSVKHTPVVKKKVEHESAADCFDDNIELFTDSPSGEASVSPEEDLGDNVELF